VEYIASGFSSIGNFLAGGVGSLKRSTRHRFWEQANLPSNIPYMSITANAKPDEVPYVLFKGYNDMKTLAGTLGLLPDNDTQVLFQDAPLGNEDSDMGKAVRKNTTTVQVHGHHWNPLSSAVMKMDPEPSKYGFPKTPQVEAHLLNLAELGLL